ncbi:MAG TPA: EAL domain-containing protein [Methylophilaceae bacterium]|nr:EAL domain-containing protein [Methylophilaceae bacterium]
MCTCKANQITIGSKRQSTHIAEKALSSVKQLGARTMSLSAQLAEEALNSLSAQIAILDETGTIILTNKAWQLFAIENSPVHRAKSHVGINYLTLCDQIKGENANDAMAIAAGIRAVMCGETTEFLHEYCCPSPDESRWYLCRVTNFFWGGVPHVVVYHGNVSKQKLTENSLRVSAIAFETQEGIIVTDAKGIILRVNRAFTEITGYEGDEAIGQNPRFLSSGRHDADFYAAMWNKIESDGAWKGEIWNRRKNGETYPEHITITAVKDQNGKVSNYVATLAEITMSESAAEVIKGLAFYDALTQLPNRRLLLDRLNLALISSAHSEEDGALLFIDLDDFKTLNDTLGHGIGDMLLQQVAQRLTACVRRGDTVARLGGDEFVVLLEGLGAKGITAAAEAEIVGNKILNAINQPYTLLAHQRHSTASIGITLFYDHTLSMETLLQQADIAMYQAKKAGRNILRFFDTKMQESVNSRAFLEAELRLALEKEQFQLYYQTQVNAHGQSIGAEVLIRWVHPNHGLVSPAQFIPLAEETGLIIPIGLWVLDMACSQIKRWQQSPLTKNFTLSVNVSANQFRQADFADQVQATLERYSINPALLKLELTENLLLENIEETIASMILLREIGVQFSLDDFGTGYSSLQYLKRLPLNQLKIDQSFVRDLTVDVCDKAIVRTIILMAQSLNLEVIAEGVETLEQRQHLSSEGCKLYQGYLFGKPMPIQEFEQNIHAE